MPKVYLTENDKRDAQMEALIAKYQCLRNTKNESLAEKLGMGRTTWFQKKKKASTMTLRELLLLMQILRIPGVEFAAAIRGEGWIQ